MQTIEIVAAGSALFIVVALALIVLYRILVGKMDILTLIQESDHKASTSRLQLLVFTFVVALCFIANFGPNGLPDVPASVLALLGISATSYTVSKGIQSSHESTMAQMKKDAAAKPGEKT